MLLVVVGALNWGLVGLFGLNLVNMLLGGIPLLERVVYILVGVSGAVMVWEQMNMSGGKKKRK